MAGSRGPQRPGEGMGKGTVEGEKEMAPPDL